MTSICLGMIVRDAENHIERCIRSVVAVPGLDRAVFIDTGCTDNTIQIIKEVMDGAVGAISGSIPYTILESKWEGHYINRTELLEKTRASGADYTIMPDADMELVIETEFPSVLDQDEYMVDIRDRGLIYPLPLITSNRREFFYAGVAHCYLACRDDGPVNGARLTGVYFHDHGGGGSRPGKIERDAELLALEVGKNPNDSRSWFYLAQSYRDLDEIEKAIAAYKVRASLGGWSEEIYQSLYQAGMLLCEHVNYYEGAKFLISAAEMKHNRAEALRALAGCTTSVADKIPFPMDEVLFVEPGAYKAAAAPQEPLQFTQTGDGPTVILPPKISIKPKVRRRRKGGPLSPSEVSAIIVTRGNVDLDPILSGLPYDDVIVWDNSKTDHNYKIFGRYAAIPLAKNPVIFWQDDDVIFRRHHDLLSMYQPGVAIANMDDAWVKGAGYNNDLVLFGAGSLCDSWLPHEIFTKYLEQHPWDDDLLTECDFAFGTLVNWARVDLGYDVREFADAPDRLYLQQGQTQRKWEMISRCLEMQKRAVAV